MRLRKLWLLAIAGAFSSAAWGSYVGDFVASGSATVSPMLQAGAPPDSPANRIDPNVPTSPFAGVVSINIRIAGVGSFICSGTMITPWHVLTAAHCIDRDDQGHVIDITQPGTDVRVILNDNDPFNAATDLITANKVTMHPDYQGFNICPNGMTGCVNDDIAIIRLSQAVPDTIPIYDFAPGAPDPGSVFTMVGYGLSGTGLTGYTVGPDFFVKRDGANVFDLFDTDDEANFNPASPMEVWYYDFDGSRPGANQPPGAPSVLRDTFCALGLACSPILPNGVETHLGGGDSGGPSFIQDGDGNYLLVANNTFGINFRYGDDLISRGGDFGDAGGGILLYSYMDWIRMTAVPEPGSITLAGLALLTLAGLRRRRRHA